MKMSRKDRELPSSCRRQGQRDSCSCCSRRRSSAPGVARLECRWGPRMSRALPMHSSLAALGLHFTCIKPRGPSAKPTTAAGH